MTSARVGVVVPLFNQAGVVARAVRSVLEQSYEDWLLVVVDDGSTDGGAERVEAFGDRRISVITTSHLGPGGARNSGIRAHDTTWVALLDADDEWERSFLARAVEAATRDPTLGCVYTMVQPAPRSRRSRPPEGPVADYFAVRLHNLIALTPSSALLHRERFLASGGFPETHRYCEDQDAWFRLACRERFYLVPEPLVRIHTETPGSLTKSVGFAERIDGLGALLTTYGSWMEEGRVPSAIQRSCDRFMQNQRACLALHQLRAGRKREGLRTLTRTRPGRFNWKEYLRCLIIAVRPSRPRH